MVMDRTRPLLEIKAHLSETVDGVESRHDRIILTRNGRSAAVIMSPDDLESIEETLHLLSLPGVLEEIRRADAEIRAGDYVDGDELKRQSGVR